jgi:hypothetical protein
MSKSKEFTTSLNEENKDFPVSYTIKFKVNAPDKKTALAYGKDFLKDAFGDLMSKGFDSDVDASVEGDIWSFEIE